ncbi:hypothetical protein IMSAGC019_01562 [Lachnospiraceae bacterium]|nr:hypothetical protein IMSAGC019_01562 [Lachnospiraceae bacterium]
MNYEKLWNDFKWHLAREAKKMERGGNYISTHKDLLAHMSIMEASEHERVSAGCCGGSNPDKNADRKEPEEKPDQNQGAERKPEPAEILKKIFGGEYADSVKDLENKMKGKTGGMIFVGPKVPELPMEILNDAKERGISIVRVSCREIRAASPFGFPIFRDII